VQQSSPIRSNYPKLPPKNPTLIYDSGAAAKIQVTGSSFSERKQKISKFIFYIYVYIYIYISGYLLEQCIEIWWFWTIYNFFKIWWLFSKKIIEFATENNNNNNNNSNKNVKLFNLAPRRKGGKKKGLKLKD